MRSLTLAAAIVALVSTGYGPAVASAATLGVQHISGQRFAHLAKPATASIRFDGDAALVQAYPIPDQTVPAGRVSLVVGSPLVNPSYVNVPIEIDLNGKFLRQVFVGYRVQRYVRAAIATHDLVPGTVIVASDVTMARIPYNGQRVNTAQVLVGRRILSAIRAGSPIAIESTQTNQIVKAGNSVVLIVHDGGVSVVADVVARTSGGLGDEIMVYNPDTRKTLSGTVIAPDRVELDLSGGAQ